MLKNLMLCLCALLGGTFSVSGQTTWTGAVDNNWSVAGNWDNGLPDATTAAEIITAGDIVSIPLGYTATALNVELQSGTQLTINAGASLTFSNTIATVPAILNEGSITNNGTISIDDYSFIGIANIDGGSFVNESQIDILNTSFLMNSAPSIRNAGSLGLPVSFLNNGTINISGVPNVGIFGVGVGATSTFTNSGTIDIQNAMGYGVQITTNHEFINDGTFNIDNSFQYGIYVSGLGAQLTNNSLVPLTLSNIGNGANNGRGIVVDNNGLIQNFAGASIDIDNVTGSSSRIGLFIQSNGSFNSDGNFAINNINGYGMVVFNGTFTTGINGDTQISNTTANNALRNDGVVTIESDITITNHTGNEAILNSTGATFNLLATLSGTEVTFTNTAGISNNFLNASGATLMGTGSIATNLGTGLFQNNGIIAPGNSTGRLTIVGDLISPAGSEVHVEIDANYANTDNRSADVLQVVVNGANGGNLDISGAALTVTTIDGPLDTTFKCWTIGNYSTALTGTYVDPITDPETTNLTPLYGMHGNTIELCNPLLLPADIDVFTAEYNAQSKNVDLDWQTSNAQNLYEFVVESSLDGINWEYVGTTPSLTVSSGDYNLEDVNPIPNKEGQLYYRLVMVNNDFSETYSAIRQVEIPTAETPYAISPNPAKSGQEIIVQGLKVEKATLYNLDGRIVEQWRNGENIVLPVLANGAYILQINNTINEKLIVFN